MKIDRRKYRKRREKGDSIGYYERKGKVWDIREKGESMGYEEGKGRVQDTMRERRKYRIL